MTKEKKSKTSVGDRAVLRGAQGDKRKEKKTELPLKNPFVYQEFVKWTALPSSLREPKTQEELAKQFDVTGKTLSRWKNRKDFWEDVKSEMKEWAKDKTPEVLKAIYTRAIKTGRGAVGFSDSKLWLQYFENFTEKSKTELDASPTLIELIKNAGATKSHKGGSGKLPGKSKK